MEITVVANVGLVDKLRTSKTRANELRLWFSSVAYTLIIAMRRLGLQGTDLAKAQPETIRLKLLKIGAQIQVTVRKVWVALAEGCPYKDVFQAAYQNLQYMASRANTSDRRVISRSSTSKSPPAHPQHC